MFTIKITGNTIEELYANLEAMLQTKPRTEMCVSVFSSEPIPAQQTAPAIPEAPAAPVAHIPANPPPAAIPPQAPQMSYPAPAGPETPPAAQPALQTPVYLSNVPPVVQPVAPPPPANPVPVAGPTYTLDQLAKAGATLAQAGKMEQCMALLAKYNVQTVNQLHPDQFGAFATELRALGAQI